MRRRDLIIKMAGTAAAWPLVARAQQPVRKIGVLMGYSESDPAAPPLVAAFQDELSQLGWKEGSNLRIDLRWANGNAERITALSKELVSLRPDVIFAQTTSVAKALAHETSTIPIVFVLVSDPIGEGLVASMSRPTSNVTGFTPYEAPMGGKWLSLLKEVAARTTQAALLFNPATAPIHFFMPSIQTAASSSGIKVSSAPVNSKDEFEGIFAKQAQNSGTGIITMPDAFNSSNRNLITALAARYNIPTIYYSRLFADTGGLITYGSDFAALFRQGAGYVDRILNGAMPSELPVQEPTKFELVINLKTSKALGLTIPQTLLATAEEVIE
jgi:putative tryptophan/tyrosine transport system substrate-binding protein